MDVRCARCNAEYEFDDSLLGEHGTTVKCSSCHHVFRVAPPSRQPTRPALKLRLVREGRVEPLSSLRDLQRRIHAGEAGLEDELGRDGFPWRKLRDVPELRSFFIKPVPESQAPSGGKLSPQQGVESVGRPAALSVSQSSMPAPPRDPPSKANRTIQGLGPQLPQIPKAPRMPTLDGAQTARMQGEPPPNASSSSDAPTDPPPSTSGNPRSGNPRSPGGPSGPVHKLYLADDESPPARATEGSSRIWIIAGVAGAIALGGVLIAASLRGKADPAPPPPVPRVETPSVSDTIAPTPTPSPEELQEAARALAAQPAPAAPGVEPAAAAPVEAKPVPSPAPAAPEGTKATDKDKDKDARGATRAPSATEEAAPRDYGGFVARGDAALARGDGAAAQKAYEEALALRASGSEASTGLGYALLSQGKSREAIAHFERAARNGYAEASIGLGDAHKKSGDKELARKAYQNYLDRLPGGARVGYATKQLELLGGGARKETPREEPSAPSDYRPAGELVAPPPAPSEEPVPSGEETP